jgi:hypothetical protein
MFGINQPQKCCEEAHLHLAVRPVVTRLIDRHHPGVALVCVRL